MEVSGRKKDSARLQWDTKPRRAINPRDIEFQTAEIVIPNPTRDQSTITSFGRLADNLTFDKSKMNRLIWGDNLLAMQALLASGYESEIDLIYIDPPFWTGENYYATLKVEGAEVTKAPSLIERLAYKDIWEGGIDSFLDMLYPRLQLMKRLLADTGSIYVHLDWHTVHYVKAVMDEVFGRENLRAEIIWERSHSRSSISRNFRKAHDTILFYSKTDKYKFNSQFRELSEASLELYKHKDGDRLYRLVPVLVSGTRKGKTGQVWRGINPNKLGKNGMHWVTEPEKLEKYEREGLLVWPKKEGGLPQLKYYLDQNEGVPVSDLWTDVGIIEAGSGESLDYPTQKPEALVERIISTSSDQDDVVLDCFLGSGTTAVAAERLCRKWIGCDFSKVSIQVARTRLVQNDVGPFIVENIGNYQRQLIYLSGSRINEIQSIILKLYGAAPRKDYPDLGTKTAEDGVLELVHVSYPDRPVTARKAEELEALAERLDGKGYGRLVILGWDYEYSYDEILREKQRSSKRKWYSEIVSKSIPPEVYEYLKKVKANESLESLDAKIQFHTKPYLKILKPTLRKATGKNWNVTVGIDRYVVFDFPIEKEEQKKEIQEIVRDKPLSLIDYWAIDWNYDGLTFKSGWQATRRVGNKIVPIPKTASKELEAKKLYTVAVRVVDVFGNDAAGTVSIDLRGMS